ncbi:MAG: nuclear transport factor 2 family protein [Sphingomonadales bacterium]
MSTLEADIRELKDRSAIAELMYRYCRYADTDRGADMVTLFTEDCRCDFYAGRRPDIEMRGRDQLLEQIQASLTTVRSGSHYVTNMEILFEDGDRATMFCYMYSWQRFHDHPERSDCHRYGRYEMHAVRTGDGWRFDCMRLVASGEYGGPRIGEQLDRPWPPRF